MADFKVLMIGGRRTGKTSVLASMTQCFSDAVSGSNLSLRVHEGGTGIADKLLELEDIIRYKKRNELFVVDDEPTLERMDYSYKLSIIGRKSNYTIQFTDVPGEFFENDEHREEVDALVSESHALIIAIDTPHLMEEYDKSLGFGAYHMAYNRVGVVTNFVKSRFSVEENGRRIFNSKRIRDKLVLFVPLKCEKYSYNEEIDRVPDAVQLGYKELMEFFGSNAVRPHVTVAITPILTLGGVEFLEFERDEETKSVIRHPSDAYRPFRALYYSNGKGFLPKYCEQPLLYVLLYVLAQAQAKKEKSKGVAQSLFDWMLDRPTARDFAGEIAMLRPKLVRKEEGYRIVQSALNL